MEYTKALIRQDQPKENPGERDFDISNEGIDRHESIILSDGWRTDNYMLNAVVQYVHSANRVPDPDLVIGKAIKIWKSDDTTMSSRSKFDVEGEDILKNALAHKVVYKLDNGFLNATSVGFKPIEQGFGVEKDGEDPNLFYHRVQDLVEWSIVPVPSNPRTLKRSLENWFGFIDKENLSKNDIQSLIRDEIKNAPALMFLDKDEKEIEETIDNPPIIFDPGASWRMTRTRAFYLK